MLILELFPSGYLDDLMKDVYEGDNNIREHSQGQPAVKFPDNVAIEKEASFFVHIYLAVMKNHYSNNENKNEK